MQNPGLRRLLGGDYGPGTFDAARRESARAAASYQEAYARTVLEAVAALPGVPGVPAIRRSVLERKGIWFGYNRPLDGWSAPGESGVEPMLGVVMGGRTLELDYDVHLPASWVGRSPLLRTSRIFWFGDHIFMAATLPVTLPHWRDLTWVMGSAYQPGVTLEYWEKLRFGQDVIDRAWRDAQDSVAVAGRVGRLDLFSHCLLDGLLSYPNHCGDFESGSILELRTYEVGGYPFGRAIRADHEAAMLLGLVIGLGHDLLESGTDIANREEHNLWVSLTDGCCCPACLGALEEWLLTWLDAAPDSAGYLTAWSFLGYFAGTWLNERHGVAEAGPPEGLVGGRCRNASVLRQLLSRVDEVAAQRVDIVGRPGCGMHVEGALPVTAEERRAVHDRFTRRMFGRDGVYCGCLHRTIEGQLRTSGLRSVLGPWIRTVVPSAGRNRDR